MFLSAFGLFVVVVVVGGRIGDFRGGIEQVSHNGKVGWLAYQNTNKEFKQKQQQQQRKGENKMVMMVLRKERERERRRVQQREKRFRA